MSDTATTDAPKRTLTATKIGTVVSDKANKTRTVAVDYQQKHPKYGKFLHRQAKFHAHDEDNASRTGDKVEIASCRPLSKTKTWRIVRIVEEGVRQEG
ncbi:MAG: 30S ribosomal protein S17 [Planctomycetota bacterium]